MKNHFRNSLIRFSIFSLLMPVSAFAGAAIAPVDMSVLQSASISSSGNTETLHLQMKNGEAKYSIHSYNGGYRFGFSLENTRIGKNFPTILSDNGIRDVLVNKDGSKTEMYILLANASKVFVTPTADGYDLSFSPKPGSEAASTTEAQSNVASQPAAPALPTYPTSISSVHFSRGENGGGLLKLGIQGTQPKISVHRSEGNRLVLLLDNTHIDKAFIHRFATSQFGTLVQHVDIYPMGEKARVVFTMTGPFSYSAYQLGQKLMVSVNEPNQNKSAAAMSPKLSMNFQNISVRDALQVIANFTHQNIVISNSVNGTISINLKKVPWQEAFKVILESQGLAAKHIGKILWVAPAGQISSQEESELKAEANKRKLEPLVTEMIPVKYANAEQIAQLLRGFSEKTAGEPVTGSAANSLASALGIPSQNLIGNSLLGPRGSVAVVQRTNSLLVRDTPSDIANIKNLVARIDKPVPQVLISAKIVQVTTDAAQELGIQWGGTYTSNGGGGVINLSGTSASGSTSAQGGSYPLNSISSGGGSTSSTAGNSGGVPAIVDLPAYAPAGSPLAGLNPASVGFALGTAAGERILNLQLQALQANNMAKIISSPKVLTQDNEKALIEQGQEIPYQNATSSGATAVSFKKAELSLAVTPHIAPNNRVTLNVVATNDEPNYAQTTPTGVPIDTQKVQTKLLVNNGQTVVIGGIYTESQSHYNTGVPVLQNIPLLGWLFKSKTYSDSKTELLVFITPKVIGPK